MATFVGLTLILAFYGGLIYWVIVSLYRCFVLRVPPPPSTLYRVLARRPRPLARKPAQVPDVDFYAEEPYEPSTRRTF